MSTLSELRQWLITYDADRPRSRQTRLGPSELGTPCRQQIARKIAGAPRRPVLDPMWAPLQGTAVHAEMENVLEYWNDRIDDPRWIIEDELIIDDEIQGHGDAFDTWTNKVVDWKLSGKTNIDKLRSAIAAGKPPREQISQDYRIQAHLYGLGHERKGRVVEEVSVVFLARAATFDASAEWSEAYNPDIAFWALDRYYDVKDLLVELDVERDRENIVAVPRAPGDACFFCPFRRDDVASDWGGCEGKSTPWP